MKEEAISKIAELAREGIDHEPITKELLGRTLLFEPQADGTYERIDLGGPGVRPTPLALHTLTGLVAYLAPRPAVPAGAAGNPGDEEKPEGSSAVGRDAALEDEVLVHVVDHERVRVLSALDENDAAYRTMYATAEFQPLIGAVPFAFGKYMDLESFNIALQTLFEESTDREVVLRMVGTVKDETVKTSTDDGVTQKVIAQAGVVGAYETDVPNPVRLRPYRTFREVPQPSSIFVLRLKKGENGNLPTAALFEADGGAWKLDAIANIATYLKEALPATITILA